VPGQGWGEGYVVDVSYAGGFYPELAPAALRFTALLGGVHAPDLEAPFTYYELGCGHGESTALLAAVNPQGSFLGVDFNPTHIRNARLRAAEGGVPNVRFLEHSFAELAVTDLPDADVVVLHGVWSWVSAENRRHIVEFMRRRLKPGGLALVSYNALPGLAQVGPLQRLLHDHAQAAPGERMDRVKASLDFAAKLDKAGAAYFRTSPAAKVRLAQLAGHDPRYIAHEYYNSEWSPFYHADVARDLGEAKLAYAASAIVLDNFDQFVIKPEVAPLLEQVGERSLRETVRDFARNCAFRKDLFTRGAPAATAAEREAALDGMRFALMRPRKTCRLTLKTYAGDISLRENPHVPVLDALAGSPLTFAELGRACAGTKPMRLRQALFALAAAGNVTVAPAAAGEAARAERARAYNAAVLARTAPGDAAWLASPVLGNGIPLAPVYRLLMAAGSEEAGVAIARKQWKAGAFRVMKEGKPIEAAAEADKAIGAQARRFFAEILPFYRMLGVA
jgi:SAM-dependent methyltransferase